MYYLHPLPLEDIDAWTEKNYVKYMSMSQETSSSSSLSTTTPCFVYVNLSYMYFASQLNATQKSEEEGNQR